MATEQYSDGYQEGHQDGWNAAMDSLPAQRKPLTHDELSKLWATHDNWLELCRAIEAAHGIKE